MRNLTNTVAALNQLEVAKREKMIRDAYKVNRYFQDEDVVVGTTTYPRRNLYPSIEKFFLGGNRYSERLLLGGNRVGKTDGAAYEVACHLTGKYPSWWRGRRFNEPVQVWAAGNTATTTRDIIQKALYGELPAYPRTGMIPAHDISYASSKTSIPNAIETIFVKYRDTSTTSTIQFKSYDQRRTAFEGTSKHIIWLDEEPPEDIYTECLLRTLTVSGILIVTFTPVEGLTPFVQKYLERAVMMNSVEGQDQLEPAEVAVFREMDEDEPGKPKKSAPIVINDEVQEMRGLDSKEVRPVEERTKLIVMIGWEEAPHLSPIMRAQIISEIPEYQRNARTKGIPHLGSGAVYPIAEEDIKIAPFPIPPHWKRGFGMDVGWNWTVATHLAYDPDAMIWYLYTLYGKSKAEPETHFRGISAPGLWIPGRSDPAANGRSQIDGEKLFKIYKNLGLPLENADNTVEAGIELVWQLMVAGKFKVFSHLKPWFDEYRMYRRDKDGRIVKKNDHYMDATRYGVSSGVQWLKTPPVSAEELRARTEYGESAGRGTSWMS